MAIRRFTPTATPFRAVAAAVALVALLLGTLAFTSTAGAQVGPAVTVTPNADLPDTGAVMAVSGTGFAGGLYVALGPAGVTGTPGWNMQANLFTGARLVTPDGSGNISTTVTANATFLSGTTAIDCRVTECGIYTWRNHTDFGDRTQDTYTPVTFATEEPTTTTTEEPTTSTTEAPTTSTTEDPTTTTTEAPTTSTTQDGPTEITAGVLNWGVKSSFVAYVTGPIANGSVTPGDGAVTNADGTFSFPLVEALVAEGDSGLLAGFGGSVHFLGHEGQLDMTISDIKVAVEGDDGMLTADIASNELESAPVGSATPAAIVEYEDVPLAVLDLSGVTPVLTETSATWAGIAATLTEDGVPAFSDFYPAGTALDPVTVVLGATAAVPADPTVPTDGGTGSAAVTPAGTLPYTGGDSFPVGLAGLVLVGGGAVLALVARRRHLLG